MIQIRAQDGNSAEQEMRGIPDSIEIGPKDIEKNQAVIVRRDTREKIIVSLDEIETKLAKFLSRCRTICLREQSTQRRTYI